MTPTSGHARLLIATPSSHARANVVIRVNTALLGLFSEPSVSDQPTNPVAIPSLIVILDGWGELDACEAVAFCHQRYPLSATLVVLTQTQVIDERFTLQAGWADIYWPISSKALISRALALHAMKQPVGTRLVVDAERMIVECNEVATHLTACEFGLLRYLIRHSARPCTSRELMSIVLQAQRYDTTAVRVHLGAVRRKLGAEGWRLRYHPGLGYGFALGTTPPLWSRCALRPKPSPGGGHAVTPPLSSVLLRARVE